MSSVTTRDGMVFVNASTVQTLVSAIFEHAGCDSAEAQRIGTRLTGANLRGHDSHGVIRTPRYVQSLDDGMMVPNQSVAVERDSEVFAVIDGRYGFGQSVGEEAVDIGIHKARNHGVSITALKNAGHLGRIGDWAERAAAAGLVSIHMVNEVRVIGGVAVIDAGPNAGGRVAYLRDRDGVTIEFIEKPADRVQ